MMTTSLLQHIQKLLPGFSIPEEQMAARFHTMSVTKETLLLAEGDPCDRIYFVDKGCLYLYYQHNGQKEVIHFALEDWWITDYKTFSDGEPAVYAITAMEDADLTWMSRQDYESLLLQFPFMALYFNRIHERAYGAALFKQKTYATVSKEDFYHRFKKNYPALLQRIPDGIFASYMGVPVEMLQAFREQLPPQTA